MLQTVSLPPLDTEKNFSETTNIYKKSDANISKGKIFSDNYNITFGLSLYYYL